MNKEYIAHVRQTDGQWVVHRLEEHLREVGRLASAMAADFKSEDWAKVAGLWHDLGKYRPAFQGDIKKESGFDPDAHIEQAGGKVDHSTAGAVYAEEKMGAAGKLLAYLIAGHHAGLPDWSGGDTGASALENRLAKA